MAKFTKLNIGDVVASSGGKCFKKLSSMLQLAAPTLSLDGDTLTITDDSKKAEIFSILANGEPVGEAMAKSGTAEGNSITSLSCSIDCVIGDTVVVAIATRDALTLSNGWTLISTSDVNSADTTNGQRLSWAYKIAESTSETITVIQATAQRLYINMIALNGEAELVDNGYIYKNDDTGGEITVNKPSGLVLWAMTAPLWGSSAPYPIWEASNNIPIIQLGSSTQGRLGLGYDATEETSITFTPGANTTMIVGCLSVRR